jgi:hypothetical protein
MPAPSSRRPRGPRSGPILALLIGFAAAGLIAEVAARSLDLEASWLPDLARYQQADVALHRPSDDPDLLFELRPGARETLAVADVQDSSEELAWWTDPRVVAINRLGHRGPERSQSKPPGTYRILCIGGSNTFGPSVSDTETWPAALEIALSSKIEPPVEVWNLGVNAYVTEQKVALARRSEVFEPDLVLFQLSNRGGRTLLRDDDLDVIDAFERDPRLYREILIGAPRHPSLLSGLWRMSHAWRAGVLATNRALLAEPPGGVSWARPLLDRRSDASAKASFAGFLSDHSGPVAVVYPPGFNGDHWALDLDVPRLDLSTDCADHFS